MAACHVAMCSAIDFESLDALSEEGIMGDDWISQLLDSENNGCMSILDSQRNVVDGSFPSLTLDPNTGYEMDMDQVLEVNDESMEKEVPETSTTSQRGVNRISLYADVDSSVTTITTSERLGGDMFNDSTDLTDFDLDPMTVMNQEMFVTETETETETGVSRKNSPSKEYQTAESNSTNPKNLQSQVPEEESGLGSGLSATSLFCGNEYYHDRKTETGNVARKLESTNNISQKDRDFWQIGQDTKRDQKSSDKQTRVSPLNTIFPPYNNYETPDVKPTWVPNGFSMEGTSSGGGGVSSNEKGGSGCSGERSSATCQVSGGETGRGTGGRKGRKKGGKEEGWEENGEVKEEGQSEDGSDGCNGEGDVEKKQARLIRNRESAQLSRQRKKFYLDELENRLTTMQATVAELNTTISHLTSENVNLRRQLAFYCSSSLGGGGGGGRVGRHLGPMIPMPNGVGNPYGMLGIPPMGLMGLPGAVPSVPIPRLKKINSGTKGGKRAKTLTTVEEKSNKSKGRKRVKTAAGGVGVVALALFCFTMLFSPFENVDNGNKSGFFNSLGSIWVGPGPLANENEQFLGGGGHGFGRVLMGVQEPQKWENESLETENSSLFSFFSYSSFGRQTKSGSKTENNYSLTAVKDKGREARDWEGGKSLMEEKSLVKKVNSTDFRPVPASLFVPKNNQLVKIDGNLIISSIMAGDKAAKEREKRTDNFGLQETRENFGKMSGNLKAVEVQQLKAMAMVAMERGKNRVEALLPSGSKKIAESKEEEGQHWFLGGIAGTILSSEECTEIFQFEKYPNPNSPMETEEELKDAKTGGPTTSNNVRTNVTSQDVQNGRVGGRRLGGRKRYSNAVPLPPVPSKNQTASNVKERLPKGESKSPRSMVVSLLASPLDASSEHGSPRNGENRDGGSNGQSGNSISKIFVVVLVNGVKYVTYSCMLPNLGGSSSTLVQN